MRPQLDEGHDAFAAVERYSGGSGWCNIRRHGLEKVLLNFPSRVADLDVEGLGDQEFLCPIWRDRDCLMGAGRGEGMVEADDAAGCSVSMPNSAAAAVFDVYNAVDFAAALHTLVKGWTYYKNVITVDAEAEWVSYQQDNKCIIFNLNGTPQVQFVEWKGLPPSFVGVEQAQQVRRDAQMKPNQNTNVQPLTTPHFSPSGRSRKIRAPALCCTRCHP
jgi:hypothetical protein